MKKYLVIGLIVLVGGALLIVPLLNRDDDNDGPIPTPVAQKMPAEFQSANVIEVTCNKEDTIAIQINASDIALLEVALDGTVLQKWERPTKNVSAVIVAPSVGSFALDLNIVMKDGKRLKDSKTVRVLSDIVPLELIASVVKTHPHNPTSFTQGLEFHNGALFESTGLYGESRVMKVDLNTGEIKKKLGLDGNFFGEGITWMNDKLHQLTWQKGKCFVYSFENDEFMMLKEDKTYFGEGWGLCNNGKELIMSDGSETIYFRDPETFVELRRIKVYNNLGQIPQLNELEYIDGKIYANVYQTNIVVSIDPETGKVLEMIRCNELVRIGRGSSGQELNGIAQNDVNGKIYMTGKNWPRLFEVAFIPVPIP